MLSYATSTTGDITPPYNNTSRQYYEEEKEKQSDEEEKEPCNATCEEKEKVKGHQEVLEQLRPLRHSESTIREAKDYYYGKRASNKESHFNKDIDAESSCSTLTTREDIFFNQDDCAITVSSFACNKSIANIDSQRGEVRPEAPHSKCQSKSKSPPTSITKSSITQELQQSDSVEEGPDIRQHKTEEATCDRDLKSRRMMYKSAVNLVSLYLCR